MKKSIPIAASIIIAAGAQAACVAEEDSAAADASSEAPAGGSGGAAGAATADASDGLLGGSGGASGTAGTGGSDSGAADAATETGDASGDPVLDVLAQPHVQDALAAAAAAGYPIATDTKREPPPLTGYYLKPLGEGRFVASGNGANLNSGVLGNEFRVTVHGDATVTEAAVSFDDSGRFGSIVTSGLLLRGANGDFTLYQSYMIPCPVQGTDRVVQGVSIQSGRFVANTGDWLSMRQINVTVAASGARTPTCDQAYAGDTEVAGGWIVSETPRRQRIAAADLQYMCVDKSAGYVAGESWTRADTTECSCSSDFLVVCG